jgi:hypothetical protein
MQRRLKPTHGWDKMKVRERIRAVVFGNEHRANCTICRVSLVPNQKNERVLQPDFRFWKARFPGKHCAQSRLVISHCLAAPQSSNHKDSQMLLRNISESKMNRKQLTPAHVTYLKFVISRIYNEYDKVYSVFLPFSYFFAFKWLYIYIRIQNAFIVF